ncbi:hypothetical protein GF362_02015 [Candidatus Dojkabacteria bacterium]|nr:hypothetical protein [Candidatus Dojkabacteria bacterium]
MEEEDLLTRNNSLVERPCPDVYGNKAIYALLPDTEGPLDPHERLCIAPVYAYGNRYPQIGSLAMFEPCEQMQRNGIKNCGQCVFGTNNNLGN